jgi:hypothetical protein
MGMEQVVTFSAGATASWPALRALLSRHGFPVQLRMIDGELAFPDEQPPEGWTELRVGTPQGMVTLRRQPDRMQVVTWGNADQALRQAWNALAWAVAEVTGGWVECGEGSVTAAEFRATEDLPAALGR